MKNQQKIEKLTVVAKLYYEKNKTQNDIANIIRVSRPMISKMLTEARELGIVSIKVNDMRQRSAADKLSEYFHIKNVIILDSYKKSLFDILKKEFLEYKNIKIGLGCGSSIEELTKIFQDNTSLSLEGEVTPLIGAFKATFKSYHTDDMVRHLSESTDLSPNYLYLPAILSSEEEKKLYKESSLYLKMEKLWGDLDLGIINISSLYTPPDLATSIRFEKKLIDERAVGRFLAHYYDIDGNFIKPKIDNIVQIEIPTLKKINNLIAVSSTSTDTKSVIGAFNSKIFTTVILQKKLAEEIIKELKL